MITPYCTAVRLRRREVDQLRQVIAEMAEQVALLDRRAAELRKTVEVERRLAKNFGRLPDDLYFRRMRLEHERLLRERAVADAVLEQLRTEARDSFGSLRALEEAAERFRQEAELGLAAAEQAAADDRAATAFIMRRKRA